MTAALISDEILSVSINPKQSEKTRIAEFRTFYGQFINSNSDLLTFSNIFAEFFRGKSLQDLTKKASNSKQHMLNVASAFCDHYKISTKLFCETLSFIFQTIQIITFMFEPQTIAGIYDNFELHQL